MIAAQLYLGLHRYIAGKDQIFAAANGRYINAGAVDRVDPRLDNRIVIGLGENHIKGVLVKNRLRVEIFNDLAGRLTLTESRDVDGLTGLQIGFVHSLLKLGRAYGNRQPHLIGTGLLTNSAHTIIPPQENKIHRRTQKKQICIPVHINCNHTIHGKSAQLFPRQIRAFFSLSRGFGCTYGNGMGQ